MGGLPPVCGRWCCSMRRPYRTTESVGDGATARRGGAGRAESSSRLSRFASAAPCDTQRRPTSPHPAPPQRAWWLLRCSGRAPSRRWHPGRRTGAPSRVRTHTYLACSQVGNVGSVGHRRRSERVSTLPTEGETGGKHGSWQVGNVGERRFWGAVRTVRNTLRNTSRAGARPPRPHVGGAAAQGRGGLVQVGARTRARHGRHPLSPGSWVDGATASCSPDLSSPRSRAWHQVRGREAPMLQPARGHRARGGAASGGPGPGKHAAKVRSAPSSSTRGTTPGESGREQALLPDGRGGPAQPEVTLARWAPPEGWPWWRTGGGGGWGAGP